MRNVDMTPTSVRVLGSLAAISIAVTSIAAALMVEPNVAVAAGAGAPSGVVLANSVEQLEEALRWAARSTIEKATFHFLTGLRRRGSLSA
jgi:hypothetical protein